VKIFLIVAGFVLFVVLVVVIAVLHEARKVPKGNYVDVPPAATRVVT
jgi:predicted secreted protein